MNVSMVVAINRKNVIGMNGMIPWKNKEDMKNFRRLTWGHPVIMGRNTYDSIGHPLKGRWNLVLTGRPLAQYRLNLTKVDNDFFSSLDKYYHGEIFVIGGAMIYQQFAKLTNKIYLTVIDDDQDGAGAVYFPWHAFTHSHWIVTKQSGWKNAFYYVLENESFNIKR